MEIITSIMGFVVLGGMFLSFIAVCWFLIYSVAQDLYYWVTGREDLRPTPRG